MSRHALAIDYINPKTDFHIELPISDFKKPTNADEYTRLANILDLLIDEVRNNEEHPLVEVMQIIGENLEQYDDEHYPQLGSEFSDIEIVKYLMESHHLKQTDLADIFGSQANVSKFLNGERPLSKNQIIGLKIKFNVSADFFIR